MSISLNISELQIFSGNGDEDFESWSNVFKGLTSSMSEEQKLDLFKACLRNQAYEIYKSFEPNKVNTLNDSCEKMLELYSPKKSPRDFLRELRNIKKSDNESYEIFAQRIKGLVRNTLPNVEDEKLQPLMVDYFINGLSDYIACRVSARNPQTIQGAVLKANIFQDELSNFSNSQANENNIQDEIKKEDNISKPNKERTVLKKPTPKKRKIKRNYPFKISGKNLKKKKLQRCFNCGSLDHFAKNCSGN